MDKLHEYVPTKLVVTEKTLVSGEVKRMEDYAMYKNLIGGDQLTVARVRGSAAARVDHQTKKDRLEGFVPVVEDWHAKQCLLKVNWVKHVFLEEISWIFCFMKIYLLLLVSLKNA